MDQLQEQQDAETMQEHNAKQTVLFHLDFLSLQMTVIVEQKQSEFVEMDQLQEQLLAEIMQKHNAKQDVTQDLYHQLTTVIVEQKQSEFVEMDQHQEQLLVETTQKHNVE
jgi:hypothetical protein